MAIERNADRLIGDGTRNRCRFLGKPVLQALRAAFRQFGYVDGLKAEAAPGFRRTVAVPLRQFAIGAGLQFTDSRNGDSHDAIR
jgi:hypothetical protein